MTRHLLTAAMGVLLLACSGGDPNPCPGAFSIGERCPAEGMVCPYPGGRCGTTCTCVNSPGAFVWDCKVETCRCQCPCGRIAINSCEALECRKETELCPESASAICEVVCADGGRPDAGPRDAARERPFDFSSESGADLRRPDSSRDCRPDSSGDASLDFPLFDVSRDTGVDVCCAPDSSGDGPPDLLRDAPSDS